MTHHFLGDGAKLEGKHHSPLPNLAPSTSVGAGPRQGWQGGDSGWAPWRATVWKGSGRDPQPRGMLRGGCPMGKDGCPPQKPWREMGAPTLTEPQDEPAAPRRAMRRDGCPPASPGGPGTPPVPPPGQGDTKPDPALPPAPPQAEQLQSQTPSLHLSSELSPNTLVARVGSTGRAEPLNIARLLSRQPRGGQHPPACSLPAIPNDSQRRQHSP